MRVSEVIAAVPRILEDLPPTVRAELDNVRIEVRDLPPAGVPSDTQGIFDGRERIAPFDDDEEEHGDDWGPWYDVDPQDPEGLTLIAFGGGAGAEGTIVLCSNNLPGVEDLRKTLYHEIAHALGFDEADVSGLGLA